MLDIVNPSGYVQFFEAMRWTVVKRSEKSTDAHSPAGFNIVSPAGYKVRAFATGGSIGDEDYTWFMELISDFCKQDGWDRAIMLHKDKQVVFVEGEKYATFLGMLYTTKTDQWFPMFVNDSMGTIDAVFEVNVRCLASIERKDTSVSFLIDNNLYAAKLFDQYVN